MASCLRALDEEPDAASVGGWVQTRASGPWGRATAEALESPFGVGHPLKWRRPSGTGRRDVEHVPFGSFPTERLRAVGITVLGSVVNGVNDDVARHGVELLMAETG